MTQPMPSGPRHEQPAEPEIAPTRGAAGAAVGLACALALASLLQTLHALTEGAALRVGDLRPGDHEVVAFEAAANIVVLVGAATWLATGWWMCRARRNSEVISRSTHRRGLLWAWLAWVVPIVAWWFPRREVSEIHRASHPRGDLPPNLNRWWALWLVFVVTNQLSEQVGRRGDAADSVLLPTLSAVSTACLVLAVYLWAGIVRQVVLLQEAVAPARTASDGAVVRAS